MPLPLLFKSPFSFIDPHSSFLLSTSSLSFSIYLHSSLLSLYLSPFLLPTIFFLFVSLLYLISSFPFPSLSFPSKSPHYSVRLWNDKADWAKLRQKILDSPMSELDVVMLEKELSKCNKTVFLASKGLPNNKVVTKMKLSVDEFNPVLPLGTFIPYVSLIFRRFRQSLFLYSSYAPSYSLVTFSK